jgi:hypothetical protein
VTIAELLALLGRAWSRLLLYPGGLAAFLAVWAAGALAARVTGGRPVEDLPPAEPDGAGAEVPRTPLDYLALLCPWIAIALLPLPYAAPFGRPLDLMVLLALLEWPRLLILARDLRAEPTPYGRGTGRLAAMLNGYPPLILAGLVLAQSAGSLELGVIAAGTGEEWDVLRRSLYLAGTLGLLLALPPLLEIGPFAIERDLARRMPLLPAGPVALGLRLRALGLVLLAALPFIGLLPPATEDGAPAPWLAPLPPLLLAALAWLFHRLTRGQSPRRWAHAYLWLSALLIGLLAYAALSALRARLI